MGKLLTFSEPDRSHELPEGSKAAYMDLRNKDGRRRVSAEGNPAGSTTSKRSEAFFEAFQKAAESIAKELDEGDPETELLVAKVDGLPPPNARDRSAQWEFARGFDIEAQHNLLTEDLLEEGVIILSDSMVKGHEAIGESGGYKAKGLKKVARTKRSDREVIVSESVDPKVYILRREQEDHYDPIEVIEAMRIGSKRLSPSSYSSLKYYLRRADLTPKQLKQFLEVLQAGKVRRFIDSMLMSA